MKKNMTEDGSARDTPSTPEAFADNRIKKATNAALFGTFLLPIASNLYSLFLYIEARKVDPNSWARNRAMISLGFIANLVGFSMIWIILQIIQIRSNSPV
jgi:hypothetical protein